MATANTACQNNALENYQDIMNCLSQAAEHLFKLEMGAALEFLDEGWKIVQEILLKEKDPLFLESLNQVIHLMKWQRKALLDKILKQHVQVHKGLKEKENNDTLPTSQKSSDPYKITSSQRMVHEETKTLVRRKAITDTRQDPGLGGLDKIAGLFTAKKLLREAVVLPMKYPQLFQGSRRSWNRILLYGPPGTGKTHLARAIASEVGAAFYSVSSADILSSWVGESEKLIQELFQYTRGTKEQSVVFFDEIDSICRQRTTREEDYTRRVKTQLLSQLESSNTSDQDTVFLLCATNCPWELDSAFLRRFQRRIYIPLPDRAARHHILTQHSKETEMCLSDTDWQLLLDHTDGYSGSDLANLTLSALMEPVREMDISTHWIYTSDGKMKPCVKNTNGAICCSLKDVPANLVTTRPVTLQDFLKALSDTPHTVCKAEIERFDQFTNQYGQKG